MPELPPYQFTYPADMRHGQPLEVLYSTTLTLTLSLALALSLTPALTAALALTLT